MESPAIATQMSEPAIQCRNFVLLLNPAIFPGSLHLDRPRPETLSKVYASGDQWLQERPSDPAASRRGSYEGQSVTAKRLQDNGVKQYTGGDKQSSSESLAKEGDAAEHGDKVKKFDMSPGVAPAKDFLRGCLSWDKVESSKSSSKTQENALSEILTPNCSPQE